MVDLHSKSRVELLVALVCAVSTSKCGAQTSAIEERIHEPQWALVMVTDQCASSPETLVPIASALRGSHDFYAELNYVATGTARATFGVPVHAGMLLLSRDSNIVDFSAVFADGSSDSREVNISLVEQMLIRNNAIEGGRTPSVSCESQHQAPLRSGLFVDVRIGCTSCQGALIQGAIITGSCFADADLSDATFDGVWMREVQFHNVDLTKVRFRQSAWIDVTCPDGTVVTGFGDGNFCAQVPE